MNFIRSVFVLSPQPNLSTTGRQGHLEGYLTNGALFNKDYLSQSYDNVLED